MQFTSGARNLRVEIGCRDFAAQSVCRMFNQVGVTGKIRKQTITTLGKVA